MTKHGLTPQERLLAQCIPEPNSGCWLWEGTTVNGYGTLTINRRPGTRAHRLSYEIFHGPIPKGKHVLHKCDVRCCVNPNHLFLGTNADNVADMVSKNRHPKGEGVGRAKLTTEQVLAIRQAKGSTRAVARRFGIGKSQAHLIKSHQSWKHLSGE